MIDYMSCSRKCIISTVIELCYITIIVMFVLYDKNHVKTLDTKYFSRLEPQKKCADVEI